MTRYTAFSFFVFSLFFSTVSFGLFNDRPIFKNPDETIIINDNMKGFQIVLPANPTTGYRWTLTQYNPAYFTLTKTVDYQASPSQLVGAGGVSRWFFDITPEFRNHTSLQTQIRLVYARPFAPQENPKQAAFTVQNGK